MNLDYLKTLVVVAECRNLTEAAERLGVSQPAVTKQIKVLEERLNTRLLIRGKKNLELTEAGILLELYGRELLQLWEKAQLDLCKLSCQQAKQRLRIASMIKGPFLTWLLENFKKIYPRVPVEQVEGPLDFLTASKDILVISAERLKIPEYTGEAVYRDKLVLLTAKKHPLASLKTINFYELARQRIFTLKASYPFAMVAGKHNINCSQVITLDSLDAVLTAARTGQGVALVPKRVTLAYYQANMLLQELKVIGFQGDYQLWVNYPEREFAAAASFMAFLKNSLTQEKIAAYFASSDQGSERIQTGVQMLTREKSSSIC